MSEIAHTMFILASYQTDRYTETVNLRYMYLNPLYSSDSKMPPLADSENPNEICTVCKEENDLQRKKYIFIWKLYSVTMDHLKFNVSNQREESISA